MGVGVHVQTGVVAHRVGLEEPSESRRVDACLVVVEPRVGQPALGRFLQTDPIGYGDGPNWYNYVHGDPVNGSDPSGLDDDDNCNDCVAGIVVTAPRGGLFVGSGGGFGGKLLNVIKFVLTRPIALLHGLQNGQTKGAPACPGGSIAQFARGAMNFGSNVQSAGDLTVVIGAGVTGLGAVTIQPEIVASGATGVVLGGATSTLGFGIQAAAGAILFAEGDPKPLVSAIVSKSIPLPPGPPGSDLGGAIGDAAASKLLPNAPDC